MIKKFRLQCPMCGIKFKAKLEDNPQTYSGERRAQCPNKRCVQPFVSIANSVPFLSSRFLAMVKVLASFPLKGVAMGTRTAMLPLRGAFAMLKIPFYPVINLLACRRARIEKKEMARKIAEEVKAASKRKALELRIPQLKPILRPIRSPLWDTELFDIDSPCRREFFTNRRCFHDGAAKNDFDTKMSSDGQLGYPNEFDLGQLAVTILTPMSNSEFMAVANQLRLRWIFGCTIPLDAPLSEGEREFISNLTPDAIEDESAAKALLDSSRTFIFNMTNHKRQARKIFSNETFRGEIYCNGIPKYPHAELRIRMTMRGIFYTVI